jgi:hypothetical protein
LVERSVYAEYQTFERNRDNEAIQYAHVDSANVFRFLAEVLTQPRNNPIQQFDKYSDIEEWLRSQWAGLFRELLNRRSNERQISSLAAQVAQLGEVNKTMRRYLEEVVTKVAPTNSLELIKTESKRLRQAQLNARLRVNALYRYLISADLRPGLVRTLIRKSRSVPELIQNIGDQPTLSAEKKNEIQVILEQTSAVQRDLDRARLALRVTRLADAEGHPEQTDIDDAVTVL